MKFRWKCALSLLASLTVLLVAIGLIIQSRYRYVNVRQSSNVVNSGQFKEQTPVAINVYHDVIERYRKRLSVIPRPRHASTNHVTVGPSIQRPERSGVQVKRILVWTTFFHTVEWLPKSLCEGQEKYCITSTDKSELLQSDAVLFHPRDIHGIPEQRLPWQRWIYFSQESHKKTASIFMNFEDYNGVFNWTSTYRLDSDFPCYYYRSAPRQTPLDGSLYQKMLYKIMLKKTRLVAAAISNCETDNTQRIEFIEKLKLYIQVDFYGFCGDMHCARSNMECAELFSEYKFYLSFENANCRDYFTEKLVHPLNTYNAVPIVMGGGHPSEYEKILPPMSYIHYKGFETVKELAEYLTLLDENPLIYEKYHKWRQTHEQIGSDYLCGMCKALHNDSCPSKVYSDLKGWIDEDVCKSESRLLFSTYKLTPFCLSIFFVFIFLTILWRKKCLHGHVRLLKT